MVSKPGERRREVIEMNLVVHQISEQFDFLASSNSLVLVPCQRRRIARKKWEGRISISNADHPSTVQFEIYDFRMENELPTTSCTFFFFGKFDEFVFDEDEEIKIAMQREKKNVKILLKVLTDYFLFILVN